MKTIPPGATIGILGSGQLGRMIALSASQLGYRIHIYAPDRGPACDVSAAFTQAAYDDGDALDGFAAACDVVTLEFENVPAATTDRLDGKVAVHPGGNSLAIAQDRLAEKAYAQGLDIATAPFAAVNSAGDLSTAAVGTGVPAILKTNRFGYDGKGQARIDSAEGLSAAWDDLDRSECVLEGFVQFEAEYSVILARRADGETVFWDSSHNVHKHGILDTSSLPAPDIVARQQPVARDAARAIADRLDYVGVLTCEFFAGADGPVFNEMAPRVHNSGHWTTEGAVTSQFENHVRAICGLPLGDTALTGHRIVMHNLIGNDAHRWNDLLADPANHLHLYGKRDARAGRKMGHVTKVTGFGDEP